MNVTAPNVKNLTRGGAIILVQLAGTTGYLDLGEIPDFTKQIPTEFLEYWSARSGNLTLARKEPTKNSLAFKASINELNVANLQLTEKSTASTVFSQASATASSITITNPVLGLSYDLGALRVTNVQVKVGATTKVAGTDYVLEADLGIVRILPTGSIMATDTVTVTFDNPLVTGDLIAPLSKTTVITAATIIFFRTSDGRLFRWKHTTAQIAFNGDTNLGGAEFGKQELEFTMMPDYTDPARPYGTLLLLPSV